MEHLLPSATPKRSRRDECGQRDGEDEQDRNLLAPSRGSRSSSTSTNRTATRSPSAPAASDPPRETTEWTSYLKDLGERRLKEEVGAVKKRLDEWGVLKAASTAMSLVSAVLLYSDLATDGVFMVSLFQTGNYIWGSLSAFFITLQFAASCWRAALRLRVADASHRCRPRLWLLRAACARPVPRSRAARRARAPPAQSGGRQAQDRPAHVPRDAHASR